MSNALLAQLRIEREARRRRPPEAGAQARPVLSTFGGSGLFSVSTWTLALILSFLPFHETILCGSMLFQRAFKLDDADESEPFARARALALLWRWAEKNIKSNNHITNNMHPDNITNSILMSMVWEFKDFENSSRRKHFLSLLERTRRVADLRYVASTMVRMGLSRFQRESVDSARSLDAVVRAGTQMPPSSTCRPWLYLNRTLAARVCSRCLRRIDRRQNASCEACRTFWISRVKALARYRLRPELLPTEKIRRVLRGRRWVAEPVVRTSEAMRIAREEWGGDLGRVAKARRRAEKKKRRRRRDAAG